MNRPSPGPSRVEGSSWVRVGRRFLAPLLVRQFPPEVPFGFLGRVVPTQADVDLTLEAHRLPAERALEVARGAQAVAEAELAAGAAGSSTAELELERDAAESLGREVARRAQELWRVGLRCVATGSSRVRAESERLRLAERFAQFGFRTRVPRFESAEALAPSSLLGSEPRPDGYWQTLPTDGVAALFPFADETVLESAGILVGLSLATASPVFLDRWGHASHSWAIFGTTGSGKSFAGALTLLRTRWVASRDRDPDHRPSRRVRPICPGSRGSGRTPRRGRRGPNESARSRDDGRGPNREVRAGGGDASSLVPEPPGRGGGGARRRRSSGCTRPPPTPLRSTT